MADENVVESKTFITSERAIADIRVSRALPAGVWAFVVVVE